MTCHSATLFGSPFFLNPPLFLGVTFSVQKSDDIMSYSHKIEETKKKKNQLLKCDES